MYIRELEADPSRLIISTANPAGSTQRLSSHRELHRARHSARFVLCVAVLICSSVLKHV